MYTEQHGPLHWPEEQHCHFYGNPGDYQRLLRGLNVGWLQIAWNVRVGATITSNAIAVKVICVSY